MVDKTVIQNLRGGTVVMQNVAKPSSDDWGSAGNALETALDLEKKINPVKVDNNKRSSINEDRLRDNF